MKRILILQGILALTLILTCPPQEVRANDPQKLIEDSAALAKSLLTDPKWSVYQEHFKQAKGIVAETAALLNMPYITERWPGGLLTNFATIRKSIKKMQTIDKMKEDGTFDTLSKRERLQIDRQRAKLDLNLGSIVKMTRMPEAIFIIDTNKENIALAEANKLGIRSFAMNDTNTNPSRVSFPIPANDDASKSIECILSIVSKAIAEGLAERDVDQDKKAEEKKEKAKQITEELEGVVTNQDEKSDEKKGKSRKRIKKK